MGKIGTEKERRWAMVAHLSGLLVLLSAPLFNILGPLLVWLFKPGWPPILCHRVFAVVQIRR